MKDTPTRRVRLPDGTHVPALGLGTWNMGERKADAAREIAALRHGLDLGMTLIDTAEMYGEGGAEEIVGRAIAGRRDEVFVVSKVYPHNAGRKAAVAACERSLRRLNCGYLDLYLLHWRGSVPLHETIAAFLQLQREGRILRFGVSNFGIGDMRELLALPGAEACATDQVLYHLGERGIEFDLQPLLRTRGIPAMAYSPIGQGDLLRNARLQKIAAGAGMPAATLALAWLVQKGDVIVIPKATDPVHVDTNHRALGVELDKVTLAALDAAFPPPRRSTPLAMI